MEALRNQVSVVLQNNVLFSGTIYDNLRWGNLQATDKECQEACRLACADEFIHTSLRDMTPVSNRVETTSPVVRSSVCVSRVPC